MRPLHQAIVVCAAGVLAVFLAVSAGRAASPPNAPRFEPAPRRWTSRRGSSRSTCRAASAPTWPKAPTIRSTPVPWCSTTGRRRWPWSWSTIWAWPARRLDEAKALAVEAVRHPRRQDARCLHPHAQRPGFQQQRGPGAGGGLSQASRRRDRRVDRPRPRRAAPRRRGRRRAPAARGGLQSPLVSQARQDAAESLRPRWTR